MGVLDIIGTGADTIETTDDNGQTITVEVDQEGYTGVNPDFAAVFYGLVGLIHLAGGVFIHARHDDASWAYYGTDYNWVFKSSYYALYITWIPVTLSYVLSTILSGSLALKKVYLYSCLISVDGPLLLYFLPAIFLLKSRSDGPSSGLTVVSET